MLKAVSLEKGLKTNFVTTFYCLRSKLGLSINNLVYYLYFDSTPFFVLILNGFNLKHVRVTKAEKKGHMRETDEK